jgi:serine/threonine protein phosphatase PrpC
VIADPDIKCFRVKHDYDFIVLCSDGVFDKTNNREVVRAVWNSLYTKRHASLDQLCGAAVEEILAESFRRRSLDNVTAVLIALPGLADQFQSLDCF